MSRLPDASAALRSAGYPTSVAAKATAEGRSWRALQVHGLLPDPFPVPATTSNPGLMARATEAAAGVMTKIPAVAKAATRKSGPLDGRRHRVRLRRVGVARGGRPRAGRPWPSRWGAVVRLVALSRSSPGPLELRASRPDRHHPHHLRGRRRLLHPRRRRLSSSARRLDREPNSSPPSAGRATCSTRFVILDQRLAAQDSGQDGGLDALDSCGPLQARLQLRTRRDHQAVVVAQDHVARVTRAGRRTPPGHRRAARCRCGPPSGPSRAPTSAARAADPSGRARSRRR